MGSVIGMTPASLRASMASQSSPSSISTSSVSWPSSGTGRSTDHGFSGKSMGEATISTVLPSAIGTLTQHPMARACGSS